MTWTRWLSKSSAWRGTWTLTSTTSSMVLPLLPAKILYIDQSGSKHLFLCSASHNNLQTTTVTSFVPSKLFLKMIDDDDSLWFFSWLSCAACGTGSVFVNMLCGVLFYCWILHSDSAISVLSCQRSFDSVSCCTTICKWTGNGVLCWFNLFFLMKVKHWREKFMLYCSVGSWSIDM